MANLLIKAEKYQKMHDTLKEKFNGLSSKEVYQIWTEKYVSLDDMCKDFGVHINQLNVILNHGKG